MTCADCRCRDAAQGDSLCPDCRLYRKRFDAQSRAMEQAGEFHLPGLPRQVPTQTAVPRVDRNKELRADVDELLQAISERGTGTTRGEDMPDKTEGEK